MINILSGIQNTGAALNAERLRLDVIAENIANAQSTNYQRKVVVFETALQNAVEAGAGNGAPSLRVSRIEKDPRPMNTVYQPGNPQADARGMVTLSNVNVHEEMADLIAASRAFEANLAVAKNARSLALQTLAIGKR